jgi:hypothetical protein
MRCRYEEYREDFLNMEYIEYYVDSITDLVSEAQARHYQKWPFLGVPTASPKWEPLPDTYEGEMEFLKNWIELRLDWLDDNLPGPCTGPPTDILSHELSEVTLYPNPSSGAITITSPQHPIDELWVYSADGKLVRHELLSEGQSDYRLQLQTPGMYHCQIKANGIYRRLPFVVE